jgi:protein-tyrosine phosphatase/membrane-associated phospholipid phosphatase
MTVAAAQTSVLLSLLFLLVYGGCNWITAQRSDVGTWYFAWERHIPFVPLMIVPYMSIDLFFIAAPFLCRDAQERRTFARRMSFAIVVAGACFLLLPLRFAFERPAVTGWLGALFNAFRSLDQPYNLFPSLHIILCTLLADIYARHTRGVVHAVLQVWFSLIALSTVLTYQHHVVDVLGGFVLAAGCFYLLRDVPTPRLSVVKNLRVGAYYGLGTVFTLGLALATWPWGSLLLWPACALSVLTTAYYGVGPGIFRKSAGRLPLSTRLLLGPVLLGQYMSLLYYRRQCHPWDEAGPGVFIGRRLNHAEAADAVRQGVTAVLDLTAEFSEALPFLATTYHNLPILDLTAPTLGHLREATQFITAQAARGTVYVHCKIGYSRSAAAIGAYLLASGQATTVAEAIGRLRQVRPALIVRPEVWKTLQAFAQNRVVSLNSRDGVREPFVQHFR